MSPGWIVVTYYRELKPWMTDYEELCRSRPYPWRWLAWALAYSRGGPVKVCGRWYWLRDEIVAVRRILSESNHG